MKLTLENQCRRCGSVHEESLQLIDAQDRWAIITIHCACGHEWSVVHTAPANLPALRSWLRRGCEPEAASLGHAGAGAWQVYRLEGINPARIFAAS